MNHSKKEGPDSVSAAPKSREAKLAEWQAAGYEIVEERDDRGGVESFDVYAKRATGNCGSAVIPANPRKTG